MKKTIWTIIVIIALVLVGWLIAATGDEAQNNQTDLEFLVERAQRAGLEVSEGSILVALEESDNSGIDGVAVLTEIAGDRTTVAVWLDDEDGNSRPVHIHAGTCQNLGGVEYPLENVIDGFSNSTLSITFEGLEAGAPLAINAHESADAIENNIACGNINFGAVADAEVIEGASGASADDEADDEEDDMATTTDENGDEDDDDNGADADAEAEAAVVTYTNAGFEPETLVVADGTTVRFVNESSSSMWVASAVHPTHEILPEFDQLAGVAVGNDYEFTFTQEGTWNYHNHLSANHTGTIVVQ